MPTTALYASFLGFLFVFLSLRVIRARRAAQIALGDGGDRLLLRGMRVQANFAEYVPLALVLMGLAESLGTPAIALHILGMALVAGRLSHAYGVSREREDYRFRIAGMGATCSVILAAAVACLWGGLHHL